MNKLAISSLFSKSKTVFLATYYYPCCWLQRKKNEPIQLSDDHNIVQSTISESFAYDVSNIEGVIQQADPDAWEQVYHPNSSSKEKVEVEVIFGFYVACGDGSADCDPGP